MPGAQIWLRQDEERTATILFQELPHALRNEVAWNGVASLFKWVGSAAPPPTPPHTLPPLCLPCRRAARVPAEAPARPAPLNTRTLPPSHPLPSPPALSQAPALVCWAARAHAVPGGLPPPSPPPLLCPRRLPFFAGQPERTLYQVASRMTPYRYGPGHDLASEGDPADRLWVMLEGEGRGGGFRRARRGGGGCWKGTGGGGWVGGGGGARAQRRCCCRRCVAGSVVALYHFEEAEKLDGPCIVGESVLLQARARPPASPPPPRCRRCTRHGVGRGEQGAWQGAQVPPQPPHAPSLTRCLRRRGRRPCASSHARTARFRRARCGCCAGATCAPCLTTTTTCARASARTHCRRWATASRSSPSTGATHTSRRGHSPCAAAAAAAAAAVPPIPKACCRCLPACLN